MKEQPLTSLRAGNWARVSAIEGSDAHNIRKLLVFGVVPGAELCVVQTYPAYVLAVDNTQLALDYEVASKIIVVKL